MAMAYLKTPTFLISPPTLLSPKPLPKKLPLISFTNKNKLTSFSSKFNQINSFSNFSLFSSYADNNTQTSVDKVDTQQPQSQEKEDGAASEEDIESGAETGAPEEPVSVITAALKSYKEALSSNDESKAAEIETFLVSIEKEKVDLENKIVTLSEELSYEKDRVLRISADFDNFRKRTERERLSVMANAQGEVVEALLPVLDNFERAKSQLKIENEGEEKINKSYQSIYKQFVEILDSLGVVPVEPVGTPFDPLLHEAIMREESTEYEDDIVIEEYRKGFKLGDRLLRPSMVKVSAGPGPTKPETAEPTPVAETSTETSNEVTEAESPKND